MNAESFAVGLVGLVAVYLGIGLVFGIAFVVRGVGRIDPAARGASVGFRLIVLPGVVALWPLLLRRWLGGSGTPPIETNAHRRAARSAEAQR